MELMVGSSCFVSMVALLSQYNFEEKKLEVRLSDKQ